MTILNGALKCNHLTLKIAGKYPLMALQRDLFWWRSHPQQVFSQNIGNLQNILNNYLFNTNILLHHSPLDESQNKTIIHNQNKIFFMNLLRIGLKNANPAAVISLFNQYRRLKKI